MRVQIVDPAAYTPPYDHALAGALARAGAEVELVTCHFPYGPVPARAGLSRSASSSTGAARVRASAPAGAALLRAAEHVPDMRRYRRVAEQADVVHYQWLPIPGARPPPACPRSARASTRCTGACPRPAAGSAAPLTRLLAEMDAVVVHSEHGARRLEDDFGVPPSGCG